MDDTTRIAESLESASILNGYVTETINVKMKKQNGGVLDDMTASLIATTTSPLLGSMFGKRN